MSPRAPNAPMWSPTPSPPRTTPENELISLGHDRSLFLTPAPDGPDSRDLNDQEDGSSSLPTSLEKSSIPTKRRRQSSTDLSPIDLDRLNFPDPRDVTGVPPRWMDPTLPHGYKKPPPRKRKTKKPAAVDVNVKMHNKQEEKPKTKEHPAGDVEMDDSKELNSEIKHPGTGRKSKTTASLLDLLLKRDPLQLPAKTTKLCHSRFQSWGSEDSKDNGREVVTLNIRLDLVYKQPNQLYHNLFKEDQAVILQNREFKSALVDMDYMLQQDPIGFLKRFASFVSQERALMTQDSKDSDADQPTPAKYVPPQTEAEARQIAALIDARSAKLLKPVRAEDESDDDNGLDSDANGSGSK